jgi:hypothetical protein
MAIGRESRVSGLLMLRGGSEGFVGEVRGDSFYLREHLFGRNSLQTICIATIHSRNGGSIIEGELTIDPAIRKILQVWKAAAILIGFPTLISLVFEGTMHLADFRIDNHRLQLVILAFTALWGVITFVGRAASRGQDDSLRRFLMFILEAREQSDGQQEGR